MAGAVDADAVARAVVRARHHVPLQPQQHRVVDHVEAADAATEAAAAPHTTLHVTSDDILTSLSDTETRVFVDRHYVSTDVWLLEDKRKFVSNDMAFG